MWRRQGLLLIVLVIALDQATKWLVLGSIGEGERITVTSFFDLVLAWNRGVSFSLFADAGPWGPWILKAVALAVVAGLGVWLWREDRLLSALAIGLIIGGAIGNVIDRARFGAVVDFLLFHLNGYYWPAFNVADSAIVTGAGLLAFDGLVLDRRRAQGTAGR